MDAFPVNDSFVIGNYSFNGTEIGKPNCTYVPVLSSIITIAGILTNGPVLLVIVKNRSTLLTPFNIYLVNLLIANLLNLLLVFPLNVIHLAYGNYWWLGNSAFTLHLNELITLNASMGQCHLLKTISRLWASITNALKQFHLMTATLSNGKRVSAPVENQIQTVTKNTTDGADTLISNAVELSTSKTTPPMSDEKKSRFGCPSIPVCGQRFLVLTLMMLLILICHTPEQVQDTMWLITQDDFSLGGTLVLLMAIPTVLNPLLFAITLADLRQALLKSFRRQ
ncbi:hypothetical protein RvY_11500 [Ramazzottius varieornatus]|uniref:G-protein coupled receptors family 1 profile domain-containing protein n=1 Tax=Ramazzottius varieornatus TaxID=947166 RepID=A0A1D1VIQ2_RAMVA|nr:hypothetical protein RvY_11500 [Ramazzottius varieornatus]